MTGLFGTPKENNLPFAFRLIRTAIRLVSRVSIERAGLFVNHLWFRTQRFPEPPREKEWLASAAWSTVNHDGRPLAVYAWGNGPTVLLVHGWHGRGAQLGAFVQPLVAAGFRVVTFDAPAHGRTPGRSTNLPEVSDAIMAVAGAFAPLHGVIAHSFGVVSTLNAIAHGLAPRRVIGVSAPSSIEFLMDSFAAGLAVPGPVIAVHRRLLEKQFGADLWQRFAPARIAGGLIIPALVLHDADDQDVPWQESETLARAWPEARFIKTEGLGHRRILRDPEVIARAVAFITAGP